MSGPALFVGVDGGASRTSVLVVDAAERLRARVAGEGSAVKPSDPLGAVQVVVDLCARAVLDAGGRLPARALCAGLAGAGRAEERARVEEALSRAGVAEAVRVVTDADAAMHDAFGTGAGILLIAGTGSVGWARGAGGDAARAGGWGPILGDEGSGYALGLGALRAVARAEDGRGRPTTLAGAVLRQAGAESVDALIRWADAAGKPAIAALAPAVFEAAERGDSTAYRLVDQAARDLAELAAALHRRLGPWDRPADIAFAGALISAGGRLREPLSRALVETGLPFQILRLEVDAARGAAALARALA